jgi:hypothetical protein
VSSEEVKGVSISEVLAKAERLRSVLRDALLQYFIMLNYLKTLQAAIQSLQSALDIEKWLPGKCESGGGGTVVCKTTLKKRKIVLTFAVNEHDADVELLSFAIK